MSRYRKVKVVQTGPSISYEDEDGNPVDAPESVVEAPEAGH